MDIAVIRNGPRRTFERLSGLEAFEGTLNAHEDLLVEIRHALMNLTKPLPNVLREKIETYVEALVGAEYFIINGGAPGNAIKPPTK